MRVIMLGPPGAGKGTQASRIAQTYDVPHISTGDIFRANVAGETPLGRRAQSYMDAGEYVPDEVTIDMVDDRLAQDDAADGWVLDGFPRTPAQVDALDDILERQGETLDVVLRLVVPDEAVVERLAGRRSCPECGAVYHVTEDPPEQPGVCDDDGVELVQREDDREDVVRTRLEVYHDQTAPLVAEYDERGVLREVDGTGTVDEVRDRAVDVLDDVVGASPAREDG